VTRRKGPLARLRRFFTGPVGPIGVTGAMGPQGMTGLPASAERGFVKHSYDVLLAVSELDGSDWLRKHRLYEGKLQLLLPNGTGIDGHIIRTIYATEAATHERGYNQALDILERSRALGARSFEEAPVAERVSTVTRLGRGL
jgi:hypothetical protein